MNNAKDIAKEELLCCLDLWSKNGSCSFGKYTACEACAAPYLLYKLCTGQVIHEQRLSLEEWKAIIDTMT